MDNIKERTVGVINGTEIFSDQINYYIKVDSMRIVVDVDEIKRNLDKN